LRETKDYSGKGAVANTGHGKSDHDLVALRIGQTVGRYRVAAVLGRGGFGITYRAFDAELGREVALKEYLPVSLAIRQNETTVVPISTSAAPDFKWGRDRFLAEGRTLATLHRLPAIVLVHDFLEANGTAYLVMELLGGQTLQEHVIGNGPLGTAAFDRLLAPLLDGLEQVHAAGFLHRDIKPANILIDRQGQPTLIDFGASRAAVAGRTQAMTAVFTPGYAAVEQFTAAAQGPWTDIYGLAATLHFAITGKAPPNAVDRVLDDSFTPLSRATPPLIAPRISAAIDAGLAVLPADRPQSIAAWRQMFAGSFAGSSAEATVVSKPEAELATRVMRPSGAAQPIASKLGPVRRPTLIASIALMIAAVAAAAWFLARPTSMPAPAVADSPAVARPQDKVQQELEEARRAQQMATEEANRLRAEAEARRKADEEAALRRKIEDEVRQKAEAEQAARQRAEEEQRRVAAEAAKVEAAKSEAAKAEAAKVEAAKAEAAKAEADHTRAEAQKKTSLPPPAKVATSSAAGAAQCDGTFQAQWCRSAFQGFPESCWYVPMTIRNGAISGQWTSQGATEPQTATGQVAPDGTVNLLYNGIGTQTNVGRHFSVTLTGSVAANVLNVKGQPSANGRGFSVRIQCR
jgi:hypothetical protein